MKLELKYDHDEMEIACPLHPGFRLCLGEFKKIFPSVKIPCQLHIHTKRQHRKGEIPVTYHRNRRFFVSQIIIKNAEIQILSSTGYFIETCFPNVTKFFIHFTQQ